MTKFKVPPGTVSKVYAGRNPDGSTRTRDKAVAYRVDHTGPHVNWSGRKSILGHRSGQWYNFNGELYAKNQPDDPFWTCVGYAPKPITDYDRLRHDFFHGMLMRYGFINSSCFALRWFYKRKKMKWLS